MSEAFDAVRSQPDASGEEIAELLRECLSLAEENARLEAQLAATRAEAGAITRLVAGIQQLRENGSAIGAASKRLPAVGERVGQLAAAEKFTGSVEVIGQVRDLITSLGVRPIDKVKTPTITKFLNDTYLDEAKLRHDARRHVAHYIRLFARVIGNKRLDEIRRSDVVHWVSTLERLKAAMGRSSRDAHKTIPQLLRESKGRPTLSQKTIENHIVHVRAFLIAANRHYRFSSREDIEDLFVNLRLSESVPAAKKRKTWSIDELNTLFKTPVWSGTRSRRECPTQRHQSGRHIHKDAYWWLPLVALHTGMRLEEIAQLRHEDLMRDKDGRPFLHLTEEGTRRLKTANSHRDVPVHSFLISIGFLELFGSERGAKPIFPELKPSGRLSKCGEVYTKHFGRYRKACNVFEPLRDFHSFRRTFVTTLRTRCGVDPLTVAALVGHDDDVEELRRVRQTNDYTDYSIEALSIAIEKLDYEALGLDLGFARIGRNS